MGDRPPPPPTPRTARQPVRFAFSPAAAHTGLLDYTTKEGKAIYKDNTAALPSQFSWP